MCFDCLCLQFDVKMICVAAKAADLLIQLLKNRHCTF